MSLSVAWDWMNIGVTAGGIAYECGRTLLAAKNCQEKSEQPLAIPELSLFRMAKDCHLVHVSATSPGYTSLVALQRQDCSHFRESMMTCSNVAHWCQRKV